MTNEELQARVEVLTAQNARLRAALEEAARRLSGMSEWLDDPGEAECAIANMDEALAETPAQSLEAVLAEAGRERAVRELRACADSLWATAETFIDATHPGWRPALKAASERCHSRAEKIAREAK